MGVVRGGRHVRRVSSSSGWVTFGRDYGMNFAAVDLDPGPLGRTGQIVMHGRDVWAPVHYVAASVTDLLRRAIAAVGDERPLPPDPGPGHEPDPASSPIRRLGHVEEIRRT